MAEQVRIEGEVMTCDVEPALEEDVADQRAREGCGKVTPDALGAESPLPSRVSAARAH